MTSVGDGAFIPSVEERLAYVLDDSKEVHEHGEKEQKFWGICEEENKVGAAHRSYKYRTDGTAELFFQRGLCGVCRADLMGSYRGLRNYDHCHKTHFSRGWLCAPCNQKLGRVRDNVSKFPEATEWVLNRGVRLARVQDCWRIPIRFGGQP